MNARGAVRRFRMVQWDGPRPQIGDGLETRSGRRYVITAIEDPKRTSRTLFFLPTIQLGREDPGPGRVWRVFTMPRKRR